MLRPATPFERYVRHPLEAGTAILLWAVFRIMPLDTASAVGGWLARKLGPGLSVSDRARRNIRRAFPDIDDTALERIVAGMWENLGRVVAEFPHVGKMSVGGPDARIAIEGREHLDTLRDDGIGGLFYSAHIANWELAPLSVNRAGVPTVSVYREANNRLVENLYTQGRRDFGEGLIPKGNEGAKGIMQALKAGKHVGMLLDQKMNDGVAVPFFGRDAMTAPALAQMALRFNVPVVGGRIVRERGARFRLIVEPPIKIEDTGNRGEDILRFMAAVNVRIEEWVRENPDQWLWLHNRWPED